MLLSRFILVLLCMVGLGSAADSYGLVAGTVFRPSGHALPGVEVRIEAVKAENGEKGPKPQRTVTTFRGEFTFRVPAKPMRYTLSVKAPGFKPLTKEVAVEGEERIDTSLLLEVEK